MPKKKGAPASPFVPEEEQPYPIPENWCWTTVDKVAMVITGGTPSKKNPEYYGDKFPFFKPTDLDAGRHVFTASEYLSERGKSIVRIIPSKSTAVCCIGSIGKSGYLEIEGTTNQQINSAIPKFNSLYLFYFMNTDVFINQLWSKSSATTISIVNKSKMESCYIPLAPLLEQHRIVSRIESLFSKLDEAKEKAQAVVDGFELRKSAILHKAFTGELTERWRKEHGVGLDSWKTVPFNDCIQKMQNGLAKRNGNIGKSYVVLRLANLTEDGFDTSDLREILLDEKEQESYSLAENDVIMVRVNGSKDIVGRQLLVPKIENWAFCDHIIRIHYQNNILPDYMIMFSKSDRYRAYVKGHMVSSAGQNTISRKGMANMVVPIPEEDEQRKIVRLLSIIFSKERQIKEAAEVVLAQIDTMKKAILARAFRGELGTNDPKEESMGELLRSIL